MRKLMLFFAALMMTLGVKAQMMTSKELEQQGLSKGYYTFEAEVLKDKMKRITTADELKVAGKNIVIQHCHEGTDYQGEEGSFLTMQSLADQYGYHSIFMQEKPIGVGIFTTEGTEYFEDVKTQMNWETWQKDTIVTIGVKTKLQTSHGRLTGSTCYVAQPMTDGTLRASKTEEADVYQFIQATDGKWQIKSTAKDWFLYVQKNGNSSKIEVVGTLDATQKKNSYFYIYEIEDTKTDTYGEIKYVECNVTLTAPSGNMFTMNQKGWSDFYEFYTLPKDTIKTGVYLPNNYGVTLSNVFYHETSNEITGRVQFPFKVSGGYTKIPVHLNVPNNQNKRLTVGDNNTVEFIEKPEPESAEWKNWYNNQNNQWYIFPRLDEKRCFEYYIQNVKTEKYIYVEASGAVILSDTPTYFKLNEGATTGCVKFATAYNVNNTVYLGNLHESNGGVKVSNEHGSSKSLLVTTMSGDELGGEDAIGFIRRYTRGTSFWDGGQINPEDAPVELKEVFESTLHEGKDSEGSTHLLYCAETGITVTKLDNVTATFEFTLNAGDQLAILGVDIVNNIGEAEYADYHFGTAGLKPKNNKYTIEDVYPGDYTIRYWVCHRTDYEDGKNHNLDNTSGKITVEGADYRIMFSQPLVNGTFAAQTTWFRLRLSDGLEKYISAQPAYMDAENNLMVTNNTPSNDYAGLWAVIGDKENGYKFYNRAWGPEYAMKTVGEDGDARTYMVPAAEASTYDIVQRDRSTKDYKFHVKLHGTANNYLQNFGGYNGTGHLSTWNSEYALGDDASVMTFETVNEEGFADRTETVKNTLVEKWMPWAAEPEVDTIIGDFAQLMLNRNSFALLDGKVFKFANADDVAPRKDMLLTVNGEGKGAGLTATGNSEDYMQFIDNGDGTFKLFHIATARYLGVPEGAVTTTKSSEAAAYTYTFQDAAHKEQLTFQTSGQTLHLKNVDNYIFMNYGDNDDASRWTVFYGDTVAQKLGAAAIEAQKVLEEITSAGYLANAGQQGYASPAQIEAYQNAIQGLSGKSVAEAMSALETSMNAIEDAEKNIRYLNSLEQLSNTGIYGIHCARGPLAYVAGNSTTHLSTPKWKVAEDITANVVANENEQFAILRTENTPAGWYYLYNITTQKFVSKDFTLTENPVCAVNFRDISGYDADYRWEVWFGEIIDGNKVDTKLNVNQNEGLALNSDVGFDAGNKFRIEYAETNEAKTAPALALINALETAKAEATAFLNDTPETVGYPVAAERTTFANAIVAASSVADVAAVKTAFVTTSNIVMPENGKAYKISAWWRNETRAMTFVETEDANIFDGSEPAYVPSTSGEATVFVCRDLGNGEYAFVSDNGYYLGWLADGKSNNTSQSFSINGYDNTLMVQKAVANNQSTILTLEEVFGTFNIRGKNADEGGKYYHMMFSKSSKNYHSAGQNDAYYGDNAHTVFYKFEEVDYTLNKVTLTATDANRDELLSGIEFGKTIGTFSAPYATVIPEGVTAYYAAKAEEAGQLILKPVDGEALPAEQGVVLIGDASSATMLPVAGETVATISGNEFEHSATGPVTMGANAYILAKGGQGIGIYKATEGSTLKQGKAYLDFGTSTVAHFVLNFSGVATDIEGAPTVAPSQQVIYDLSGRRVNAVTKGGIYIVNGKKMIIK